MAKEFDPISPKYRKVEELPKKQQGNFVNIPEGGFVYKKTAARVEPDNSNIYGEGKYGPTLQEQALELNTYVDNKNFLINEAPKLVREKSFREGIIPVAEKIGQEVDLRYGQLQITESLLRKVLEITNDFDKDAKVLLDAVADSVIKNKNERYSSWSHSVCHPIETYGGRGDSASFLDTPESRKVLTKLVNESVKRQKESTYDVGCSDRIVGPIKDYNLQEAGIDNLEKSFVYKPESLNDKEYIKIMKDGLKEDEYYFWIKAFLDSNSPLEYYRLVLENGKELPGFLEPAQQIELLQNLEKNLSHEVVDKYVKEMYKPNGKDTTYDELIRNSQESKKAQEIVRGVYVDVEGTLIRQSRDGQTLNKSLVENLEKFAADGREITVFTGGDVGAIETALKRLGFPEKFLPVRSKSDFRGKLLEILVDDTPPEYQGFGALKKTDIFGKG